MSNGFEFYEGTRTESKAPQITLRKSGQLVLTSAAVALMGEDVTHVQIGYDPKAQAVGLRPAAEGTRGRYRLRPQRNGSSLVDGRRFCAHNGLTVEKARTFDAETLGDGIMGFRMAPAQNTESDTPKKTAKPKKAAA